MFESLKIDHIFSFILLIEFMYFILKKINEGSKNIFFVSLIFFNNFCHDQWQIINFGEFPNI
jgi:hypothetical protein